LARKPPQGPIPGLFESKTLHKRVDKEVERLILRFPREEQSRIYDALILLQEAGTDGLTIEKWAAALRAIYTTESMPTLRKVIADFRCCVVRKSGMTYIYAECESPEITDSLDPFEEAGNRAQVENSRVALAAMQALKQFRVDDIASALLRSGLGVTEARTIAQHYIQMFALPMADGRYHLEPDTEPANSSGMDMLRSILQNPSGLKG
jgi:hypothetical protein